VVALGGNITYMYCTPSKMKNTADNYRKNESGRSEIWELLELNNTAYIPSWIACSNTTLIREL
jgi:hypothetical protein